MMIVVDKVITFFVVITGLLPDLSVCLFELSVCISMRISNIGFGAFEYIVENKNLAFVLYIHQTGRTSLNGIILFCFFWSFFFWLWMIIFPPWNFSAYGFFFIAVLSFSCKFMPTTPQLYQRPNECSLANKHSKNIKFICVNFENLCFNQFCY